MKKWISSLLSLTLISSSVFASGFPTKGEIYVTHCDQIMGLFPKGSKGSEGALEKRLLELADTPAKMLQLIFDYDLVFSKAFSESTFFSVEKRIQTFDPSRQTLQRLRDLANLPPGEMDKLIWETLERSVDLKATNASTSQGQISYLQAKNLVPLLKASPHKPMFDAMMRVFFRHSLLAMMVHIFKQHSRDLQGPPSRWWLAFYALGAGLLSYTGVRLGLSIDTADPIGAVFGGLLGVIFGLAGSAVLQESIRDKMFSIYTGSLRVAAEDKYVELLNALDQRVRITSGSLFDFANNKDSANSILSIKSLCKTSACALSPVQIAYLGHVDVLELENLSQFLGETVKGTDFKGEVEALRTSVRKVYDSPLDYSSSMNLLVDLEAFIADIKSKLERREAAAKALIGYASEISRIQADAVNKPYADRPKTKEDIAKNEILLQKIREDFGDLQNIKVNTDAINRRITDIRNHLDNVSQLLTQAPKGQDGWKDFAEKLTLALDDFR